MRAVIYGGANSLDNFLARPDGGVDWLRWTAGSAKIMRDLWQRIDTMLMGRKTYEVSKRMSPPRAAAKAGAKQPQRKTPDGETIPSVRTFIFSRTLPDEPGVEIVREDDEINPQVGLQKLRKMVESDKCDIITGIQASNASSAAPSCGTGRRSPGTTPSAQPIAVASIKAASHWARSSPSPAPPGWASGSTTNGTFAPISSVPSANPPARWLASPS